jgi:hypothetical protein
MSDLLLNQPPQKPTLVILLELLIENGSQIGPIPLGHQFETKDSLTLLLHLSNDCVEVV